jgi:hypothetical protein
MIAGLCSLSARFLLCREASSPSAPPRYSSLPACGAPKQGMNQVLWAGYTFGALSTQGNGSGDAVLPIVECHSMSACLGGETSLQCFQGYTDTRCACEQVPSTSCGRLEVGFRRCGNLYLGCSAPRFGCRCGTCDIGYYGLWGRCHECGHASLVFFLSRAVPALGTIASTAFFFWGGIGPSPRRIAALVCVCVCCVAMAG